MSGVVQNSAGTTQTKAAVIAAATARTVTYYTLAADLYKADHYASNAAPVSGSSLDQRTLLARAGQEVSSDDLARWFPAATFTSMTPATGLAAGGTVVTIKGTNLRGVANVTFGGTNGTSLSISDDEKTITVTTPAKSAGTYAVVLKDDAGDVAAGNFVYT